MFVQLSIKLGNIEESEFIVRQVKIKLKLSFVKFIRLKINLYTN